VVVAECLLVSHRAATFHNARKNLPSSQRFDAIDFASLRLAAVSVDVDRPVLEESLGEDYKVVLKYFDLKSSDVNFFIYAALATTELMRDRVKLRNAGIDYLISDRDIASFYIYSRLEDYKFLKLDEYEQIAERIYQKYEKPDITFYLRTDMETILKRVENRGKNKAYYDEKELKWWQGLYNLYENWALRNAVAIDTTDPEKAKEQILSVLKERKII